MMETLNRTDIQRQESEDRYRNLVESAAAGIVTFLANGKIVISNHLAESFFAVSKQELLGMTIFDFLENGETLKQKIIDHAPEDHSTWTPEVIQDRIHSRNSQLIDVEVTLILASATDHVPMYTVLIKERS